ncbi:quercetin dioxygenase-like cupin family protein [Edaphobacter lichenicola]|uniref:Quercetin dioxygenase-like cupin family protein n=1 Tax=Tunturiibacter lichenicola TaxID=2051959 RepID=A0A852VQH1_9BACT|nr:quercetin dioxygenase-like cupin family protein [Edaphobacter lichenicola]
MAASKPYVLRRFGSTASLPRVQKLSPIVISVYTWPNSILFVSGEVAYMAIRNRVFSAIGLSCVVLFQLPGMMGFTASGQQQKLISCKPAAERTQAEGCWIVANRPLSKLPTEVFWTLDAYPTRESAERASTVNSAVVEALGKTWLFTVGEKPASPSQGSRITQIGPLPVKPDEVYTAQYMEGILEPGSVSRTHVHSGPEAFYTESGESCLETPEGKQIGRKGTDVIVPEGVPMELVASGSETRRGIILVLHSSAKPATTVVTDWKSKGLCSSAK